MTTAPHEPVLVERAVRTKRGFGCPRCHALLLRDYDDFSCYVCGYRTAGPRTLVTADRDDGVSVAPEARVLPRR